MAYATLAELRALDGLGNTSAYPDETLSAALVYAEDLIDRYTGTSWEHKTFTLTVGGTGSDTLALVDEEGRRVLFPRTLTSVTIDGDAQDTTGWALFPEGLIIRPSGTFKWTSPGLNVVVVGTAGATSTAPEDIQWAARTIARQFALELHSRLPERALQLQSDFGQVMLAQAGGLGRPTSLPDVNAVLNARRHRPPAAF